MNESAASDLIKVQTAATAYGCCNELHEVTNLQECELNKEGTRFLPRPGSHELPEGVGEQKKQCGDGQLSDKYVPRTGSRGMVITAAGLLSIRFTVLVVVFSLELYFEFFTT